MITLFFLLKKDFHFEFIGASATGYIRTNELFPKLSKIIEMVLFFLNSIIQLLVIGNVGYSVH